MCGGGGGVGGGAGVAGRVSGGGGRSRDRGFRTDQTKERSKVIIWLTTKLVTDSCKF